MPARRRRRGGRSRAVRVAAPLAIPMALGLALGIVLAVSGGNTTKIDQSPLGASGSPTVSAPAAVTAGPSPAPSVAP
jgi:hypothetical protein